MLQLMNAIFHALQVLSLASFDSTLRHQSHIRHSSLVADQGWEVGKGNRSDVAVRIHRKLVSSHVVADGVLSPRRACRSLAVLIDAADTEFVKTIAGIELERFFQQPYCGFHMAGPLGVAGRATKNRRVGMAAGTHPINIHI